VLQESVDALLRSVNGQSVVTSQGYDDSSAAFSLPPRPTSGASGSAFATITMIVLFLMLLLSLRRQVAEGGVGVVAARERDREREAEAQGQLLSAQGSADDSCGSASSGPHQRRFGGGDDDTAL